MTDKKIVDDYYLNITSKESSDKKGGVLAKRKIKIKAKIVKPIERNEDNIMSTTANKTKEKAPKFKKVIETIPVIRKPRVVIKRDIIKKNPVSSRRSTPSRANPTKSNENRGSWNKNSFNNSNNWPSFKTPFSRIEKESNSWWANITRGEKIKKVFTNNKVKTTSRTNAILKAKADTKTGFKKTKFTAWKTRWKFNFREKEKELTFSRSLKVNTKEEKKIEDIKQNLIDRSGGMVVVSDILSLKEFSEKIWIPLIKLIAEFMKNWMMVNINSKIDFESASIIAEWFNIKLERDESSWIGIKDILWGNLDELLKWDDDTKLTFRSPVVSIMWHVDHGKTSILDYIRNSKVTSMEAWWITQSIWAYQTVKDWKNITFLDTPWHEAFSVMRARWAKLTDIAVLVVAADEWVKPQTIESINHAKEAWISVIVAINKMDKEWANPDHVKWQLAENWLTPEDWWWDTPMVPVSAQTGFWIDDLLEIILLVSEMKELKANPNRLWVATVIESHLDLKLGPVATVLINTWNVNKWDNIVCSSSFWKVKILKNFESKNILKALPWDPVLIVWLDKVVEGWDIMQILPTIELARTKAFEYSEAINLNKKSTLSWLDVLMSKIKTWNLKQLKVVLKADTNGSLEAMKAALSNLSTPETNVLIIHSWVWWITESDVIMCEWSSAILVWFWVDVLSTAKSHLGNSDIEFISNKIIYHITERIEKIVTWMLDPREVEVALWNPKVLAIFYNSKKFMVVWLKLRAEERIEPNSLVRVIRKTKMVGTWKILSMKLWVEEVNLIEWPIECWIKFSWNIALEINDKLEIYKVEIHK